MPKPHGSYNPKLEQIVDENLKAWPKKSIKKIIKPMNPKYESVEDCIRKSMKGG